jgi:hypothetical protein
VYWNHAGLQRFIVPYRFAADYAVVLVSFGECVRSIFAELVECGLIELDCDFAQAVSFLPERLPRAFLFYSF